MPNPKYKTSRSKTRRRRSHLRLSPVQLMECPRCHEAKLSHRVCASCGYYKGREVLKIKEKA
ncbi:MAG: 50S ribosomal protein L32 [Firmicutes bacterium]|nr:50S ribosomal protein L32 [Bacillota bacterium]